jgi:hypothetical protein
MLIDAPLPFIKEFIGSVDQALQEFDPNAKLSFTQKKWLSFCCMAIAVTNSVCWAKFSRSSLGKYSDNALCWMFCHSKIHWESILKASVGVVLKKYGIQQGTLLIDDSDRQRSKSTKRIFATHKIKDKKTGGYFMGQCIIMLVLVTPGITIPVGFSFYMPDPELTNWNKLDKKLRKEGVTKKNRPSKPEPKSEYPGKTEIALSLLDEFERDFPQISIQCVLADALYGCSSFFKEASKKFGEVQVISQLKNTQKVFYKDEEKTLEEYFSIHPPLAQKIHIRGEKEQVVLVGGVRLKVKAHGEKRFVIALKYEGETEYRYIVASDLSWRSIDIVQAYTLRWLVEVFFQDWKSFEGWGQLAKQFDEDGSRRTLILSLLPDHGLLFHQDQLTCLKNKLPAYTVGSLLEKIKAESLLQFIKNLLFSETHGHAIDQLSQNIQDTFHLRNSGKHMANRYSKTIKVADSFHYKENETQALDQAA